LTGLFSHRDKRAQVVDGMPRRFLLLSGGSTFDFASTSTAGVIMVARHEKARRRPGGAAGNVVTNIPGRLEAQ
jgi:hypothetical protein